VEAADEPLAEGREARPEHLAACASCRSEVAALAEVLRDVAAVAVPEPSPLFWDHFSAQVRARCSGEAAASPSAARPLGGSVRLWRLVGAAVAVMVLLLVAGRWLMPPPSAPATVARSAPAARENGAAAPAASVQQASVAADDSWSAFTAVASEADPSGDVFTTPAPGLADDAVLQMTDEERGELVQLLKDELARRAARSEG
jgi:hypothetical protein